MTDSSPVFRWESPATMSGADQIYITSRVRAECWVTSDELFNRFRRDRGRTRLVAMMTGFGVVFTVMFVVAIVSSNSARLSPATAWIAPVVIILTVGMTGWVFLATSQLWHWRVRHLSRSAGLATFAIGLTPIGRSYLVIEPDAISVVSKADLLLARLPKSDISQVALEPGRSGVGLAIGVSGGFLEMPIVLKVAGPTAQGWSTDGWIGQGRLQRALSADLKKNGYSVTAGSNGVRTR